MVVERATGTDTERQRLTQEELLHQYQAYRRRQARRLIRLLPLEAVRPLYRRALQQGFGEASPADPLAALVLYCESLLPLPPFAEWYDDFARYPSAHLQDLDDSAEAPTAEAPSTLAARPFDVQDERWLAYLRCFRDGVTWTGYITFENERSRHLHRTALIFRESDPVDLRERFLGFETTTLHAFLRSALP